MGGKDKGCLCQEDTQIEGQVGMHFQIVMERITVKSGNVCITQWISIPEKESARFIVRRYL